VGEDRSRRVRRRIWNRKKLTGLTGLTGREARFRVRSPLRADGRLRGRRGEAPEGVGTRKWPSGEGLGTQRAGRCMGS
jgi:hypothetical protein